MTPRAVAVVPQHQRRPAVHANHQIQITIHLQVGSPESKTIGSQRTTLVGARCGIRKRAVDSLSEEPDAPSAGRRKIHPEVVVPIERHEPDATGCVGSRTRWKRQRRRGAVEPLYLALIGRKHSRDVRTVECDRK